MYTDHLIDTRLSVNSPWLPYLKHTHMRSILLSEIKVQSNKYQMVLNWDKVNATDTNGLKELLAMIDRIYNSRN